ncbi:MAG: hypothetical protein D6814_17125, partial [Calditrichaeota bacterium]
MVRKLLLVAFFLSIFPALLHAQDGKLRGRVTDKETGEPLIGVNVIIEGTTLGSATDASGDYIVLGVPPGVYSVRCSYIGYRTVTISNVRVNAALTTTQDFQLESSPIEMESIQITAERPLVQRNTTNTVRMTTQEDIQNLSIRGLQNIVALNAGAVQQNGELHIRGGRQREVAYFVDGVTATNPMFNSENVTVIQEAIEEIQMQSGGYTAEFGGANSAVIRTTMRTGGPQLKITADYRTDDFAHSGQRFLGTTSRGYRNAVLTIGGPLTSKLRFFVAGQHNYARNRTATYVTPFRFDELVDDGLEGREAGTPLPGPVEFGENHLPKNQWLDNSIQGTLAYRLTGALNLRLSGSYRHNTYPLGHNNFRNALENLFWQQEQRRDRNYGMMALKATHLINTNTFYEVNVNWTTRNAKTYDPIFGDDWQKYSDARAWAEAGRDTTGWQSVFQG